MLVLALMATSSVQTTTHAPASVAAPTMRALARAVDMCYPSTEAVARQIPGMAYAPLFNTGPPIACPFAQRIAATAAFAVRTAATVSDSSRPEAARTAPKPCREP